MRPRGREGCVMALLLQQQDESSAVERERPVAAVQRQLERASVGGYEAAVSALLVHVECYERAQIARRAAGGPGDAAGVQARLIGLEAGKADHLPLPLPAP